MPGFKNWEVAEEASTFCTRAPLYTPNAGTQRSVSSTRSSSATATRDGPTVNANTSPNPRQSQDPILMGPDDGLSPR